MARKIAAGNWKMNGTSAALKEVSALAKAHPSPACEVLICPPATLLSRMAEAASGTPIGVGGQDCHAAETGAHTGDVSAQMLKDAGATHVILGHSERRADHGESDDDVKSKVTTAWDTGLTAIVCVGETLEDREAGKALDIVESQLKGSLPDAATGQNLIIAYEPVWAIGTGKTPSTDDIAEMHAHIRSHLKGRFSDGGDMPILYGGSVKPGNAAEIFAVDDVDGSLVGGASLKADDFGGIIAALGDA